MGYRDDFYIADNIVGYTGLPSASPSVYFRKGTTFGRITQVHDLRTNIGRAVVRDKADYRLENGPHRGKEVCLEFYDGAYQHPSRNPIVFLRDMRTKYHDAVLPLLAQAITAFPDIRERHRNRI
ncbi:hypothetical protein [Mangrovicoccus sp. HB161399]|uniref:hypothetical protein n=1 Tax=Mangrovicoccus sp. HB161399 TaxID=2720392 RepID=UPI00155343B1|nr:hypothetical protein [Mangrovicoccus sp. HB161399]